MSDACVRNDSEERERAENMMAQKQFFEYIQENIKEFLPARYQEAEVSLMQTIKDNDTVLTGLIIRKPGESLTPNLYLEHCYEKYLKGVGTEILLNQIGDWRVEMEQNSEFGHQSWRLDDYDWCKKHLTACLCHPEMNKENLKSLVHTKQGDFEAYYRVLLDSDKSIKITDSMLDIWGIDVTQLHEDAINSEHGKDVRLNYMTDMIGVIDPDVSFDSIENVLETGKIREDLGDIPMLILSNGTKTYGAAAMLHTQVMDQIWDMLDQNYYILPSSAHELILVPYEFDMTAEELNKMIQEINESIVAPEDRLAEEAFIYDRVTKEIVKAIDHERLVEEIGDAMYGNHQSEKSDLVVQIITEGEKNQEVLRMPIEELEEMCAKETERLGDESPEIKQRHQNILEQCEGLQYNEKMDKWQQNPMQEILKETAKRQSKQTRRHRELEQ